MFYFKGMKVKRGQVVSQLQDLQNEVEQILNIISNDQVMKETESMRDSKTLINYLSKFDVSNFMKDALK